VNPRPLPSSPRYYKDVKSHNDTAVGYVRIEAGQGPNITVAANSTQLSPEVQVVVDPVGSGAIEDVMCVCPRGLGRGIASCCERPWPCPFA
jgi:hypothetical protein